MDGPLREALNVMLSERLVAYLTFRNFKNRRSFKNGEMQGNQKFRMRSHVHA